MDQYGNFSNEFEAAFECSRRTATYPRQQHLIDAHVANGKHVLAFHAMQFCAFTDATLGLSAQVVSVHDSREEAVAALHVIQPNVEEFDDSESYYLIYSPKPVVEEVAIVPSDEDDVPF